jgi:hypothetical protein
VDDPYAAARKKLEDTVLAGPGRTAKSLRQALAAQDLKAIPEDLRTLAEKIEKHAIQVTDAEFTALKAKYTEDDLFEIVIATTLGASMRRINAGLAALEEVE